MTRTKKSKYTASLGPQLINKRIAKFFDKQLYFGTITNYNTEQKFWCINYDDDDYEEMEFKDLNACLKLYDRNIGKDTNKKTEEEVVDDKKEEVAMTQVGAPSPKKATKGSQPCPEFGEGWTMTVVPRKQSKQKDRYWYSPEGTVFTSKVSVERYLAEQQSELDDIKEDVSAAAASPAVVSSEDTTKSKAKGKKKSNNKRSIKTEDEKDAVKEEEEVQSQVVAEVPKPSTKKLKTEETTSSTAATNIKSEQVQQAQRKFGKTNQQIKVDPNIFQNNPCRITGSQTNHPSAYPNSTKGKGSFAFLIQRLSDRNYAMRALCLDNHGATYTTYQKKNVNYISVVWFPPLNLNNFNTDMSIVDGCHLDLIHPDNGRTFLTGDNLNMAIDASISSGTPVECLFLNGAQSNPGSEISANDIAASIMKCKDTLLCLALTECKINIRLLEAIASCTKLRGVTIENCQLWGKENDSGEKPNDSMLSKILYSCVDLRWVFIKSSIFGNDCWTALADNQVCPNLEVLWVDAPLHTFDRTSTARGDHDTIRSAINGRSDMLKLYMFNPDDKNKSRYIIGGEDRLNGTERSAEGKLHAKQQCSGVEYLSTV